MKPTSLTEDLLWDYADGLLAPDEAAGVEAELRLHPFWRKQYEAILRDREALRNLPFTNPSAGFAKKVMQQWQAETHVATQHGIEKTDWIVRGLALAFSAFILIPLIAIFVAALGSKAAPSLTGWDVSAALTRFIRIDLLLDLLSHPVAPLLTSLLMAGLTIKIFGRMLLRRLFPSIDEKMR